MRRIINLALLSALAFSISLAQLPDDVYNKYLALDKEGKYKEAIAFLMPYAQQGDDVAQLNVGFIYAERLKDVGSAIKWYQMSAKAGNATAKYNMGLMYYDIFDDKLAFKSFEEAAKLGQVQAISMVGIMYYHGKHVKRDYKKAVKYLSDAANKGDAFAQYHLAQCYKNSHGVAHDPNKVRELLEKSAKGGFEPAKKELGSD
ncbi:tetratricopeptide repeat protein [Campylobacter sp. MOP51]|uniref:tetratricopeptide repeat protein n=1 Tax=Campylobacter canis TaxID=3378588 RepID=UPI003C40D363